MNLETGILIFAVSVSIISLIIALVCLKKHQSNRSLLEFTEKQIEDLQEIMTKNKESFETNSQRVAEQSRRIAWLESRIRQPKSVSEENVDEPETNEPQKPNITERRHRVITLAARGQNAETIAATLGMMPGEVELIINLNQAAAVAK